MKEVRCHECGKLIKSVDDLMVVGIHFSLVPLCPVCFAKMHKKPWWFTIYPRSPINHPGFWKGLVLKLILYFIATLIALLIFALKAKEYGGVPSWVYLLVYLLIWSPMLVDLLWSLLIRYISWVRYEKNRFWRGRLVKMSHERPAAL